MEHENDGVSEKMHRSDRVGVFQNRNGKWVSGLGGGVAGAIATILFIVIPVINTWLANAKEVSLAQIKNTAEQVEYITKRMADSDKERDLYKSEMIVYQRKARELEDKLHSCHCQ